MTDHEDHREAKTEKELRATLDRCKTTCQDITSTVMSFYNKNRDEDFKHELEELEFIKTTPFYSALALGMQTGLNALVELFEKYTNKSTTVTPKVRQLEILEILWLAVTLQSQFIIDRCLLLVDWSGDLHPFYESDGQLTHDPFELALYNSLTKQYPELKRFDKPSS
jgi:hypothetical protein